MGKIIDGNLISDDIKSEIKQNIKLEMIKPSLAVIQVGENQISNKHIEVLKKACDQVGIYFRHCKFNEDTSELTIINKIKELNNDEYVNGIVIETPLPCGYNEKRLMNTIINSKDVDGLTDINIGRLIGGRKTLVSSTALAVFEILKREQIALSGKNVVLIGRGRVTNLPLMPLFLNENATVTICHSGTKDLSKFTKQADIIVSAAGENNLITADMIKEDAIVIDIGINYDNDTITGDVDVNSVSKKALFTTPTPGGVGPITTAMLLKNVIYCYQNKKK